VDTRPSFTCRDSHLS